MLHLSGFAAFRAVSQLGAQRPAKVSIPEIQETKSDNLSSAFWRVMDFWLVAALPVLYLPTLIG